MVNMHALLLVSCIAEVSDLHRPFIPWLGWPMLAVVVLSTVVRWWCVTGLGRHWNPRLIVIPDAPLVRSGPYRWLHHPNYTAVVVEVAALPLVHSAWLTALVFSIANALVLTVRIRAENTALGCVRLGALSGHPVGGGVHPLRHLKQVVLAYPVRQGVSQLPQFNGTVAQLLAEPRLGGRHDFSCEHRTKCRAPRLISESTGPAAHPRCLRCGFYESLTHPLQALQRQRPAVSRIRTHTLNRVYPLVPRSNVTNVTPTTVFRGSFASTGEGIR